MPSSSESVGSFSAATVSTPRTLRANVPLPSPPKERLGSSSNPIGLASIDDFSSGSFEMSLSAASGLASFQWNVSGMRPPGATYRRATHLGDRPSPHLNQGRFILPLKKNSSGKETRARFRNQNGFRKETEQCSVLGGITRTGTVSVDVAYNRRWFNNGID